MRNITVCLLALVLIVLREPRYFTQPRFWAEEATVYFYTAYRSGFADALFAVHQGYYSLVANVTGILANIPPLEYAPVVSTVVSLMVQLLVVLMVLLNETLFGTPLKKIIASIAVLVVGAFGDIWLTSINSQHYFPLIIFLILVDDKEYPAKRKFYYVVTVLAGLSSVAANFLAPLFLVRYYLRRHFADRVLFLLLSATIFVQIAAIAYSGLVLGDAAYFLQYQAQSRFSPTGGIAGVSRAIFYYALEYPVAGPWKEPPFWTGAAVIGVMAYALWKDSGRYWTFVAAIWLLTILSIVSSMEMIGGGRYAYSSSLVLVFLLLDLASRKESGVALRAALVVLISVSFLTWGENYRTGLAYFNDPAWPVWSREVQGWRADPARVVRAHPQWESQTQAGILWSVNLNRPGNTAR